MNHRVARKLAIDLKIPFIKFNERNYRFKLSEILKFEEANTVR
jgi:hypothetical protein